MDDLSKIKAGDCVAMYYYTIMLGNQIRKAMVGKVTPKFIIVEGSKYNKKTGYLDGNKLNKSYIKTLSEAEHDFAEQQVKQEKIELAKTIRDAKIEALSIETLRQIVAMVEGK